MRKDAKFLAPGSKEARDAGCTCPVLDNEHGKGYMGLSGVYIYSGDCPIHRHLTCSPGAPKGEVGEEPQGLTISRLHWEEMGWSLYTTQVLLMRFIQEKGLEDDLEVFLQKIADEEQEEAQGG